MATGFNTTGLAAFTAANPQKALAYAILEGIGTKDHYSYEEDVKYSKKIPYVTDAAVDISIGSLSGYNTGSGSTTTVDVTLTSNPMKIFETYEKDSLNRTILAGLAKKGSDTSELPFEDIIIALKGKTLPAEIERLIWQADDTSSRYSYTAANPYVTLGSDDGVWEGVLAQVYEGGAKDYAYKTEAFSALSDTSVLYMVNRVVNLMENKLPEFIPLDTILSMSPAHFAKYSRALYNLNGTVTRDTIGADGKPIKEVMVPGTNVKAVSEPGLNGRSELFLSRPQNIIVCYDLVNEDSKLEFRYNPWAFRHELAVAWKLGVKVVDTSACIVSAIKQV